MQFEKKKEGYITFSVLPEDSRLYINGKLYSDKENIRLEYGRYNYNIELTGYDSLIGAFILDEMTQTIKLNMTEKATATPTSTAEVTQTPEPTGSKVDTTVVSTPTASTGDKVEATSESESETDKESSPSPTATGV